MSVVQLLEKENKNLKEKKKKKGKHMCQCLFFKNAFFTEQRQTTASVYSSQG